MQGKRIPLKLAISVIVLLCIVIGCRRYFSQVPDTPVKQARKWFHKKYDDLLQIKTDGKLANGNKYPDWRHTTTYKSKYFLVTEMPLIEDNRQVWHFANDPVIPETRITSLRKLLICERDHKYREAIMTIVPRKEYLDKHDDLSDITINNIPSDFSGIVFFESFRGEYMRGFVFKDGKIAKRIRPRKQVISQEAEQRTTMEFVITESIKANCWTTRNVYNGATDLLVNTTSTYNASDCHVNEWEQLSSDCSSYTNPFCECAGTDVIWETCNFTGTEQYSNYVSIYQYDNIGITQRLRDSLPCLDSLLRFTVQNPNFIAQLQLYNIFGVSQYVDLEFDISPTMNVDSPLARMVGKDGWVDDNDHFHFEGKIVFNPYYMKRASKELKIATIVHESIHAYIRYTFEQYKKFEIDSNTVKQRFPFHWEHFKQRSPSAQQQHKMMAELYIDLIESHVRNQYNSSASESQKNRFSEALAWGGLSKDAGWTGLSQNLYIWDTCKIKAINFAAQNAQQSTTTPFTIPGCPGTYTLPYTDSLKMTPPCN